MSSQPFELVVRQGKVVTEEGVQTQDIGIQSGKIAALAPSLAGDARQTIDAGGMLVFPGFIDAHTHMGIPIMNTHSIDDFESGSVAAACGGVTTIIDFTVQDPGQSLRESVDVRLDKAAGQSHIDFALHVNITDQPEKRLAEIPDLVAQGLTAFKVFSTYRQAGMMVTWEQFRQVLECVNAHGGLLCLHAEENDLVESLTDQNVAAGNVTPPYHPRSRTAEAEARAIARAAEIAGELDAPLYIVHLSSRAGLEAGLHAREQRVKLYLETCPQYLVLSEEIYQSENGHYWITTPPLRTRDDNEALWQALAEGQIDVVATDHCPFTIAQKEKGGQRFHLTPNGIAGVETLFPLLYTYGVARGRISLEKLVEVLAGNPARIFGLSHRKGALKVGADADLVIWEPSAEKPLHSTRLHGNADWSPYEGFGIAGNVTYTIQRGRILVQHRTFIGENLFGDHLAATP
ncbi:MAG: dihydropyrimidinase [bacterium]